MSVTLKADAGAIDANSYVTLDEAQAYFDTRLFTDVWDNSENQVKALMMATRVLDAMSQPHKTLVPASASMASFYRTLPQWKGTPTTTTQALQFPRTGLRNVNGADVDPSTVPTELKNATAELALQLLGGDRTLDSDIDTLGVKSFSAGPVSFSFKDQVFAKVIPDAVWNLIPQSWLTDMLIEYVLQAEFASI